MNENQTRGAAIPITVELDKARPKHNYYKGETPEFQIGWHDKEQTKPHMAKGLSFCSTPELAVQAVIDSLMVNCWIDRPEEIYWDGQVKDVTFRRPGAFEAPGAPVVTTKEGLLSRVVAVNSGEDLKGFVVPPSNPNITVTVKNDGPSNEVCIVDVLPVPKVSSGEGLLGRLSKKG